MIINYNKPDIESIKLLDEHLFSIDDVSLIFDILRNKLYSNPILSICREISCNARDAHREVQTPDLSIHIYIPNNNEAFYKVKDFGPGISPDRMTNIFIKYTASTKRSDNIQTGGMGIGAKTPFSYSSTFNVLTNYNGTHYNYQCFIDETKVGKLVLIDEYPTDEVNGTEICIPVKSNDFHKFYEFTEIATRHWKVKPFISGQDLEYKKIEKLLEGNNWAIVKSTYKYNKDLKIIIDDIEYSLNLKTLEDNNIDTNLVENISQDIYLYFNTGELSLSANREQIYLDKQTISLIKEKLLNLFVDIKNIVSNNVNNLSDYYDANVYFTTKIIPLFGSYAKFSNIIGMIYWNGTKLIDSKSIRMEVLDFEKNKEIYNNIERILKSRRSGLEFKENSIIFINDLDIKNISVRHIKKAFNDNPKLKSVQLINLDNFCTETFLKNNFNLIRYHKLSEITKIRKTHIPSSSRLTILKFDPLACDFHRTSYIAFEQDDSDKVLCLLDINKFINYKNISYKDLQNFNKIYGTNFYGIDEKNSTDKINKYFSNFQSLEDYIDEKLSSYDDEFFIKIAAIKYQENHIDSTYLKYDKFNSLIKDKNSLFLKNIELNSKSIDLLNRFSNLLNIYQIVKRFSREEINEFLEKNSDYNLNLISENINKKYPLLNLVGYKIDYYIESVIEYVNLIDMAKK
jgi:hypothetical protein